MTAVLLAAMALAGEPATKPCEVGTASVGQVKAFRAACADKAAGAKAGVVAGLDDWLFLSSELRHLGAGEFWGDKAARAAAKDVQADRADPLPPIIAMHEQLKGLGMKLIVVPIPARATLYPDKLLKNAPMAKNGLPLRTDAAVRQFTKVLQDKGVCVIDPAAAMIAARADEKKFGPICCRTDTHFSPRGAKIVAGMIGEELRKLKLPEIGKLKLACKAEPLKIKGDLVGMPDSPGADQPAEELPFWKVGRKADGGLKPVEDAENSPVLLMGDSHLLVFHTGGQGLHATGGGLADHLAMDLGMACDVIGVRGSAATTVRMDLIRKAWRNTEWIKNKKAVVWVFTVRELTEAGWRKLPDIRRRL
jgi:alginate O-acetyltransferase complex protein AlgJ